MDKAQLAQFTGSTQWFRHAFNRAVVYTEGIQYLMDEAQAYWLVNAVAAHLCSNEFQKAAALDQRIALMHFWKLAVHPDRTASLTAVADTGEQPFIQQAIPFTDFPLDDIDIWAQHNGHFFTLMLPSEY
jgi:hypothetical protein